MSFSSVTPESPAGTKVQQSQVRTRPYTPQAAVPPRGRTVHSGTPPSIGVGLPELLKLGKIAKKKKPADIIDFVLQSTDPASMIVSALGDDANSRALSSIVADVKQDLVEANLPLSVKGNGVLGVISKRASAELGVDLDFAELLKE